MTHTTQPEDGPTRPRSTPEPHVVRSVGHLVAGGKPGHLCLAQSVSSAGYVDNVLAIPIGMVQRIHSLTAVAALPMEPEP